MSSSIPPLQSIFSTSTSSSLPSFDLKIGDIFTVRGPSIYRDITPPENYPLPAPDSSHSPRPLIRELVGTNGLAQSSDSRMTTVAVVLPVSIRSRAQVIVGVLQREGSGEFHQVSLEIYHLGLPCLEDDYDEQCYQNYGSPYRFTPEIEAANYHTYRALQGREIPLCYGIFSATISGAYTLVTITEAIDLETFDMRAWAEKVRRPGDEVIMGWLGNDGRYDLTAKTFATRAAADAQLVRRFVSCNKSFLPLIPTKGALRSSTEDLLLPVVVKLQNPTSLPDMREYLRQKYLKEFGSATFDSSSRPPGEVDQHLNELLIQISFGAEANVISIWKTMYVLPRERYSLEWDASLPL